MPSNFQKVTNWNIAIGNRKGNPANFSKERVAKQLLNIPDELGETFIALGANEKRVRALVTMFKAGLAALDYPNTMDVDEVRDGLIDQHVFLYGAHHIMGIDADEDMESVVQALYTRFIKNPEDEIATIKKHAKNGIVDIYLEGDYPVRCLKSASDQPDAPTGKFLKSASFTKPKLLPVPKHHSVIRAEGGASFCTDGDPNFMDGLFKPSILPQTSFDHEAEQAVLAPLVKAQMAWAYTFSEFVAYGREAGANIVNGMPWSFSFHGYAVSHENDTRYLISTPLGTLNLTPNDLITVDSYGNLSISVDVFSNGRRETEIVITNADAEMLVGMIDNPPQPNEALLRAFARHQEVVTSDMNDEARKLLDRHNANINGSK